MATASPENPFTTCLVGLPLDTRPHPPSAHVLNFENNADPWNQWVPYLPSAALEPQELELLGSVKMDLCVKFNYSGANQSKAWNVSLSQPIFKTEITLPPTSFAPLMLHYHYQQECFSFGETELELLFHCILREAPAV